MKNIVFLGKAGNDLISLNDVIPIKLAGSPKVFGGSGSQTLLLDSVIAGKNVLVKNGVASATQHFFQSADSTIGGNVTIQNGGGDSYFSTYASSAGHSSIRGNLTITNGLGADNTFIIDTHVRGDVTVRNGRVANDADTAGVIQIYKYYNTGHRSIIGGNVKVVWENGTVSSDGIGDTEVFGNATFHYGPREGRVLFRGDSVNQPVQIHGNLTIKATEKLSASVTPLVDNQGLEAGGNLINGSGSGQDILDISALKVAQSTKITPGGGDDSLSLDDSSFFGKLRVDLGPGANSLNVETRIGTQVETRFFGPTLFQLGADSDTINMAGGMDAGQPIVAWKTIQFMEPGGSVTSIFTNKIRFPFGGAIEGI